MKRSLISNSVWNLVTGLSAAVVALVVPPVMTRTLSVDAFGAWALALQIGAYVNILGFGVQVSVGRFTGLAESSHDPGLRDRVTATATWALAGIAGLSLVLVAVFAIAIDQILPDMAAPLRHELSLALPVLSLSFGILLPGMAIAGVFNGLQRSDVPAKILASGRILTVVVLVAALLLGVKSLLLLAALQLFVSVGTAVALFIAWRRTLPDARMSLDLIDRETASRLAHFSAGLLVWNLAMLMVGGFDLLIVGRYDVGNLAPFAAAITLANFVAGSLQTLAMPIIPAAAAVQGKDIEALRQLLEKSMRWLGAVSVLVIVPLLIARDYILTLWLGPGQGNAAFLGGLLVASFVRNLMLGYAMVVIGTGRQHAALLTPVAEGLVCLGGSLLFVRHYGAEAVVIAKIVGAFVGISFLAYLHPLRTEIRAVGRWPILLASVAKPMLAALVVAALMAVVDSLPLALSVIVKATIGAFIALGVVWLMLLRSDDHQEVQAILRSHMGLRFAK